MSAYFRALDRKRPRRPWTGARDSGDNGRRAVLKRVSKRERPLAASSQLAIDLDENLRVQKRAVANPPRPVDAVAVAKRVQAVRRSRVLFSRKRQRVDDAIHADRS